MIKQIISEFVETPNEENKQKYLDYVTKVEIDLLAEAEELPYKTRAYFDKRIEAFAFRRNCAVLMINAWVSKYGTSEGCVVSYADTLNIPFREIKP
ncbi:MAG: hypothetical protein RL263_1319 [Bacteroidota bacterium]